MGITAVWHYTDEYGLPLLRKVRRGEHEFRMQAARYTNGRLYWKREPGCIERWQPRFAESALYNLPILKDALINGRTVYLVEGERDADTLTALFKLPATTNWQGASDFTRRQADQFVAFGKGASRVRIIADNDPAGIAGAWLRRQRLIAAGVGPRKIRILRPANPAHSDATDVALAGLGLSAFERVRPSEAQVMAAAYNAERASRRGSSDWMAPTPSEAAR